MSLDFQKHELSEFCTFSYGKMPKKDKIIEDETKYPIFSGYQIVGYYDEYNIDKNELIVIARGVGGTGDVKLTPEKCYLTNLSIGFSINSDYALTKYLYYYFQVNHLGYLNSGSAQPQITINDLKHVEVPLPTIDIQSKIVKIINNIDKKIEVCNLLNKNLEQLLHTVFNYWFISFDKFKNLKFTQTILGDIPEGWKCGSLRDLLTLTKNTIKANETNGLPYLPIDIIPMNSLGISELKSDEEAKSSLITFDKNGILIGAMRVYFHRVVVSPCSGVTRSTCFVLKPKKDEYLSYLLLLCNLNQTIQYAQNTSKGTTMPYAVWDNGLGDMDIVVPPETVLNEFHELVFPIIEKIRDSYNEINKLQRLRDTLLPKLMSGEIDVSKINCDL